jgi:hypothetical protein
VNRVITRVNPTASTHRALVGVEGRVTGGVRREHRVRTEGCLAGLQGGLVTSPAPAAEMRPGPAGEARRRHGDGQGGPPGQVRLGRVPGAGREGEEPRDGTSGRFGSPDTPVPRVIHPLLPLRPRMPASLNSWAYAANNTLSRRVYLTRCIEVEADTSVRFPAQWRR